MNLSLPIYLERRADETNRPMYVVRPLFVRGFEARDALLSRALARLARDVRKCLNQLGEEMRHDGLLEWTFNPVFESRTLSLRLALRRRVAGCRFHFVSFKSLGGQLAFSPTLPDLWFVIRRGQRLRDRAEEVYAEHFLKIEREAESAGEKTDVVQMLKDMSVSGKTWTDRLDLDFETKQKPPKKAEKELLTLFDESAVSGARELDRVGRCLDWLYPDELDRAYGREAEIEEITRWLGHPDRRPLLLVGPPQVGKTAVVHEYVYTTVAKRKRPYASKRNTWLLSPQRLISGMSYVGQWENRVMAIIAQAKKKDHVLYFDDLIGLFHAGVSRDSDLTVVRLIKPFVERRELRILGEITPEAFRVLKERDRGFADLFHVIPIKEPKESQTLEILLDHIRRLEGKHHCQFDLEVLPTVLDIQRRYVREAAFPGKAARFLQDLAAKFDPNYECPVTRDDVINEFRAKSGLTLSLSDGRKRLERREVVEALAREIIGQDDAVAAMAEVVAVAKARLNDPERPLGTFLFLGPTGVGKTQCAKALAKYLFGDEDRLLRFDMNEYVADGAAARLVGTFDEPDGLLTTAVRRQPFAVVLLDEIEKAHPEVLDLLLQVLGEGRLTDGLGRTVDFGNAIVILTSNLGVRQAALPFGFRGAEQSERQTYVQAAEKFFRPEFFNRLDRIVPFNRLAREDVRRIAGLLIKGVFDRDGLLRRQTVLHIDPAAMEKIVEQGYHPQLGARALKRAIERHITRPIAGRLAGMYTTTPTIIRVYPSADGIAVQTQGLIHAPPNRPTALDMKDEHEVRARVQSVLDRIEDELSAGGPDGSVSQAEMGAWHFRYFAIREQMRRVETMLRSPGEAAGRAGGHQSMTASASPGRAKSLVRHPKRYRSEPRWRGDPPDWNTVLAAHDMAGYLTELSQEDPSDKGRAVEALQLVAHEAALLHAMARSDPQVCDRVIMYLHSASGVEEWGRTQLRDLYEQLFEHICGYEAAKVECPFSGPLAAEAACASFLQVEGPNASLVCGVEAGTHLFTPSGRNLNPVQVGVLTLGENEKAAGAIESFRRSQAEWRDRLDQGRAAPDDDPLRFGPVIRVYDQTDGTLDVRTEWRVDGPLSADDLRLFVLAQLPCPPEYEAGAPLTEC